MEQDCSCRFQKTRKSDLPHATGDCVELTQQTYLAGRDQPAKQEQLEGKA